MIISNIKSYFQKCWKFRFLVFHLVGADLRARFRRSYLGILWAVIQPLALASLFAYVLSTMFNQPFEEQCAYVFSGVVAWELFAQSLSGGSHALLNAEGFLRQSKIPLLAFHIRQSIMNLVMAIFGFIGFSIFCLIAYRDVFSLYWLMIVPWFLVAILFTTPLIMISSIVNILYRDYQQAIGVLLQGLWYVTPAFIPRYVFEKGALAQWSAVNPVTALLDMIRDPLISHKFWDINDLICIFIWIAVVNFLAVYLLVKNENKLIYAF